MKQLQKLKEEYKEILNDIQEHPDHIKYYNLKEKYENILIKENEQISKINIDDFIENEEEKLLKTDEYKKISRNHQIYWNKCYHNLNHMEKINFLYCEEYSNNLALFFKRNLCNKLLVSMLNREK